MKDFLAQPQLTVKKKADIILPFILFQKKALAMSYETSVIFNEHVIVSLYVG